MKRTARLLTAIAVLGLVIVGVAAAASSPTVATGNASKLGDTTATLSASVNPNGNDTGYVFQYGVTSAYGLSSTSHSAGSGSKAVTVTATISGLTPGTVYHYRVAAINKSGSAVGSDRTFKTTGAPPASVVSGPPVDVRKTVATVTGSVNPEGATTNWVVQYGLTTSYGVQTFPQQLDKVTTALPVSLQLSGLAPATLFHYRIVAYHNGNVVSSGADQTFFTEPDQRPKPRLSAKTTPSRARHKPYTYTTTGALGGASFIPASARCSGSVKLSYYLGSRRIGVVVAPVGPDCKFTAQNAFRHIVPPASVRIAVHFNGNGYIAPADRSNTVTAG